MTTDLEDQLTAGMREHTAGITFNTDVLDGASRAHRRGTAIRRTLVAAGALGLVGAVAVGVAVAVPGPSAPGANHSPVASADSPQLRLAAVLSASTQVSYQVSLTVTTGSGSAVRTEGAFDPATATGYLNAPFDGGVYQQRLVNGVLFDGVADASGQVPAGWKQEPGTHDRLVYDPNLNGAAGASADPDQLFDALRGAQGTVTQTATDTYHFTVTARSETSDVVSLTITLTGDVIVGPDQRIAKVVYQQSAQGTKRGDPFSSQEQVDLEFSGYGLPVSVDAPANPVVVTS